MTIGSDSQDFARAEPILATVLLIMDAGSAHGALVDGWNGTKATRGGGKAVSRPATPVANRRFERL